MGIGVFVGMTAAAIGVFGGTGVSVATTVGVEAIAGVGVCVGVSSGARATAGADLRGDGVGGQDGSHPRRQRKSRSGVGVGVGGGGAACATVACQYQLAMYSPTRAIVVAPPTRTRNDAKSSLNIVRLLSPEVIQGGGLRIPFAVSSLMNPLSRSIIATPTRNVSNEQTKRNIPLDCQIATVHTTAATPIFHI